MGRGPSCKYSTPCFNGDQHVHRFLDSILTQTYSNIELIFINDGSTDKTEEIVLSYREKFEQKGIKLIYVFQENKGLGGAINTGLKKVTGKYLCWPDADDYLEPESVESRLHILEKFSEYAVVTSDAYIRSIENLDTSIGLVSSGFTTNHDPDQFIHLLNGKSIFCSGAHMVRKKEFFETHPSGEIFPARKGQNYQMLLPLYYQYKRYFLNKPLYNYVRYESNMSKIDNGSLTETLMRNNHHQGILLNTLSTMKMGDKEKSHYMNIVNAHYARINFKVAMEHREYELVKQVYNDLKKLDQLTIKIKVKYIITRLKKYI